MEKVRRNLIHLGQKSGVVIVLYSLNFVPSILDSKDDDNAQPIKKLKQERKITAFEVTPLERYDEEQPHEGVTNDMSSSHPSLFTDDEWVFTFFAVKRMKFH